MANNVSTLLLLLLLSSLGASALLASGLGCAHVDARALVDILCDCHSCVLGAAVALVCV